MTATPDEARQFAADFRAMLHWVRADHAGEELNEVVRLVRAHLGSDGVSESVVTKALPPYEHVNLQAALDDWMTHAGRTVRVQGVAVPPHWNGLTLQQLLTGEGLPPVRLSAPQLVDLPSGPGRTTACLQTALLLVDDPLGQYVVMVRGPEQGSQPALTVEVAGIPVAAAQQLHAELAALRSALNVYRGQVVEAVTDDMGGLQLNFADLPRTRREDVVLPPAVMHRVERHTIDVAEHRDQLRAAGQHLNRGLLLFGPPGTGKTHTTRYVIGRMTGYTVLLLTGRALHLIGGITALARELQPAVIVLEDVDLIAEDRGFGPGSSPILFELLDAMDGAAADADLLFLLTTNRADLLEPALAARPGRVDVAIEIGLPDADGRARLFDLYAVGVPLEVTPEDVREVVERTAGTTASFLKELIRRAILEALAESTPLRTVTAAHVRRALDDLFDSSQGVTRALLGVDGGGAWGAEGGAEPGAGAGGGWSAARPGIAPHVVGRALGGRASGGHGGFRLMPGAYTGHMSFGSDEP